ncbi:MAG: hypothetical protein QGG36_07220 [Pirellulaceae bacterium]|jgi:WD40 repeat protein|nr:hypothetical protein [Pirellulaceae bacterium]
MGTSEQDLLDWAAGRATARQEARVTEYFRNTAEARESLYRRALESDASHAEGEAADDLDVGLKDRASRRLVLGIAFAATAVLAVTAGLTALASAQKTRHILRVELDRQAAIAAARRVESQLRIERVAREQAEAYQYQLLLADSAFEDLRFYDASQILQRVPKVQTGWETRRLRYLLSQRPVNTIAMADGHCQIVDLAVDSAGQRAVSTDASGRVLLWDLSRGERLKVLREGRFSKDRRRWLHHYEERELETRPTEWGPCYVGLSWLAGSSHVVGASLDGTVSVFDTNTGEHRVVVKATDPLYTVASSGDGFRVAIGGANGQLFIGTSDALKLVPFGGADRAVTDIVWLAGDHPTIAIGSEDGHVKILRADTLEIVDKVVLPGPIWSLDATRVANDRFLAVGCGMPQIQMFQIDESNQGVRLNPRYVKPLSDADAVHYVRFAPGGMLYAFDDAGRTIAIDHVRNDVLWGFNAISQSERKASSRALRDLGQPKLAFPLRRKGSHIHVLYNDGARVVTTGRDATIKVWSTGRSPRSNTTRISERVGADPRIHFDRSRPEVLWALSAEGKLSAIDSRQNRLIAQRSAHAGGAADIAQGKNGDVVTAGGDNNLGQWALDADGIQRMGVFGHTRPLISAAVSPDGELVVAVDDAGTLVRWDYDTKRHLGTIKLNDQSDARPLTGRLAFSSDGRMLAVFGSGQACRVFETASFKPIKDQPLVAGNGGSAMVWSLRNNDLLLIADDWPRYVARHQADEMLSKSTHELRPESTCVAMINTPDESRIVVLEEEGRIQLLDPTSLMKLYEFHVDLRRGSDIAIDAPGRRLAVAATDGAIEVFETAATDDVVGQQQTVKPVDETDLWRAIELVRESPDALRVVEHGLDVDRKGRIGVLAVRSKPSDLRDEGALTLITVTGEEVAHEAIEVDGTYLDRRVSPLSACLVMRDDGQYVVFRRRLAKRDPYDGDVYYSERTEGGAWRIETIASNVNDGHFPTIQFDQAGKLATIRHFSFGEHAIVSSRRDKNSMTWIHDRQGLQGDGYRLNSRTDAQGAEHLLFKPNRFNNDSAKHVYLYQPPDARAPTVRQTITAAGNVVAHLEFLPDGSPIVMVRPIAGPGDRSRPFFFRRRQERWQRHASLPETDSKLSSNFAVDSRGDILMVSWDARLRQILLWRFRADHWTSTTLVSNEQKTPNWSKVLVDQNDQPIALYGQVHEVPGWLRMVTMRGRSEM